MNGTRAGGGSTRFSVHGREFLKGGKLEIMRFAVLADQILRWLVRIQALSCLLICVLMHAIMPKDRNFGFPCPLALENPNCPVRLGQMYL
jgi:hypothetical protein